MKNKAPKTKQRTDKAFALCGVVARYFKQLRRDMKCKCPDCESGRLSVTMTINADRWGIGTNVYECDICHERYI